MTAPDRDGRPGDLHTALAAWIRHGEAVPDDATTYERWIVNAELRALLDEHPATPDVAMSVAKRHEPPEVVAQLQVAPTSSKAGNKPAECHYCGTVSALVICPKHGKPEPAEVAVVHFSDLRKAITEALAEALNAGMDDWTREEWVAIRVGASDWLRDHDAALTAKAKAEGAREALREAADALNTEGLDFKVGGWGSNEVDQSAANMLVRTMDWLRERADRSER